MPMRDIPVIPIASITALGALTLLGWIYLVSPSYAQIYAGCPGPRSQPDSFEIQMIPYCRCWASETHGLGRFLSRIFLSTANQDAWDESYRALCEARVLKQPA